MNPLRKKRAAYSEWKKKTPAHRDRMDESVGKLLAKETKIL
jgi:hypothetical protein